MFEKLSLLKNGKAPGPDGWPVEVFKKSSDQIYAHLAMPGAFLQCSHLLLQFKEYSLLGIRAGITFKRLCNYGEASDHS